MKHCKTITHEKVTSFIKNNIGEKMTPCKVRVCAKQLENANDKCKSDTQN